MYLLCSYIYKYVLCGKIVFKKFIIVQKLENKLIGNKNKQILK